jgi:hypothetical protein
MASVLNNHPGWQHSRSRDHLTMNERYPLDQWLDGQVWRLVQGEDFTEDIATFRSGLRHWAKTLYSKSLRSSTSHNPATYGQPGFDPRIKTVLTVQALP